MLSYGSGIRHNEIQFLTAGADRTCTDIVESNHHVFCVAARI